MGEGRYLANVYLNQMIFGLLLLVDYKRITYTHTHTHTHTHTQTPPAFTRTGRELKFANCSHFILQSFANYKVFGYDSGAGSWEERVEEEK